MATIIDGKAVSAEIKEGLAEKASNCTRKPCLAVVLAGDDPASAVYVRNKKTACEKCGFDSREYILPSTVSQQELLELIDTLNKDAAVDGILVQSPLPRHLDERACFDFIVPDKDVDGFHTVNVGKLASGSKSFVPCTALGVMKLLEKYGVDVCGKECVIVGRSNIVGKPLAMLMLENNATVTICHSKTKNLADVTRRADVLVAATGRAKLITADMVKPGAVVIDVGITRTENGLVGDVDFVNVKEKASMITPVPGGVGPMTIAVLLENTYQAYLAHTEKAQ